MKIYIMIFALLSTSTLLFSMAEKPQKRVRWAEPLFVENRPKDLAKVFQNFQDVTNAICKSKSNEDARKKLLAAYKLEDEGTISNISATSKQWIFDVECPGYLTNDFYRCSVISFNDGKLFQLESQHVSTVPTAGIVYSFVLGIAGGLAWTWKS